MSDAATPSSGTKTTSGNLICGEAQIARLIRTYLLCQIYCDGRRICTEDGLSCKRMELPLLDRKQLISPFLALGEGDSGRQRTPLTMLIPPCVLMVLGIASGIVGPLPRFAAALESAAARFRTRQQP
jgi:hypothetical protein